MAEKFGCNYVLEGFCQFPLGEVISRGGSWLRRARTDIYEGLLFGFVQLYRFNPKLAHFVTAKINMKTWQQIMRPGQAGRQLCFMRWPQKNGFTARVNWKNKKMRLTLLLAANPTEGKC